MFTPLKLHSHCLSLDRKSLLDNSDPGIVLLCLFVINMCEIGPLYYCSVVVGTLMPRTGTETDFCIDYLFNIEK